jgi:hypothetical protein
MHIAKVAKAMERERKREGETQRERERERERERARAREPKSPAPELQVLQKMKQRRLASFSPSRSEGFKFTRLDARFLLWTVWMHVFQEMGLQLFGRR